MEQTKASPTDRQRVEDLIHDEAYLLDEWQLDEWLELFTEDTRYVVPATDLPDGDPDRDLVLIDDDITRLRGRVERLKSRRAHREYPWSRTRRLVTNVRVLDAEDGNLAATASFAVYRIRSGNVDVFVGRYDYVLVRDGDDLKIKYRRARLDLESLSPHGAVSMIL